MADLRMPEVDRIILSGNLTRDPELTHTSGGTALCKFAIAHNTRYKTKEGESHEDTFFINVTVWGKFGESLNGYLRKGHPVIVEGRLSSSEWEDRKSGEKRQAFDIVADKVHSLAWQEIGENAGATKKDEDADEIDF